MRLRSERCQEPHPVTKVIGNLHVITSFFNPCQYKRPLENYWRFREALKAPLHTIELLFGDQAPAISDAHHVRSNTVLWHKESLLNLLIDRLPADVDAIAWIDADILFQNPNWVEDTCKALGRLAVVQLFEQSFNRMPDGSIERHKKSTGKWFAEGSKYWRNFTISHPGFAWAARADWLRQTKLSDIHIIGGADTNMVGAFCGRDSTHCRLNPAYKTAFMQWWSPVNIHVRRAFGYVAGNVHHLWHGYKADRHYIVRWSDLQTYDPSRDLRREPSGLWAWTDTADVPMVSAVANHFRSRNEDAEYIPGLYDGLVQSQGQELREASIVSGRPGGPRAGDRELRRPLCNLACREHSHPSAIDAGMYRSVELSRGGGSLPSQHR